MGAVEVILLLAAISTWLYWWSTKTFSHWKDRGVAYIKPMPFFGNSFDSLTGRMASYQAHERNYKELSKYPLAGVYRFRTPVFYAHRPELIEAMLIKDFGHFYNRGLNADEELDPFSSNLVNLEDERWKNLRNKLTPVFSSGKLRMMEEKIMECAWKLVTHIKERKGEALEAKELMSGFGMNVILAVAFGLEVDAINNPDSKFRNLGGEFFKSSWLGKLWMYIRMTMPKLLHVLRWKAMTNDAQDFFVKVIRDTVKHRESNGVEGKDFLQLLINLRKEDKSSASNIVSTEMNGKSVPETLESIDTKGIFSDQMLIANAFVFFSAGFETTASSLSFCLFELSQHHDIQERLYREIREILDGNNGELSYDVLKQMSYLDQVINESLRLWPPAPGTLRICTKDYKVPNSDLVLRKGDSVMVPIFSIHHDSKYWPDPYKFDPDRFSPERKDKIIRGTFLPFGDGPRICIGMRFAKHEMKVALTNILLSFKVTLNPKTKTPIQFKKNAILLSSETGIWLNFEERSNEVQFY